MAATSKASSAGMKVIFGAMTIGKSGVEMARIHSLDETKAVLDMFQEYGHDTVDTARVYSGGSSEEYLGALDCPSRGIKLDTKLYPTAIRPVLSPDELYHHSLEDLRRGLLNSLKVLKVDKVTTWYLHGPDRTVPFVDTLRAVNELYKEGLFERYGISNYQAWEVAQMCELCEKNGWVKPDVYQGLYNALHRAVEAELFPCLRYYGLSFYCFNPLAGGFLTSRYTRGMTDFEEGCRFDPKFQRGKQSQSRYFDNLFFDALDILRPVAKEHGLSEAECALRWLSHHSQLKQERGDGIIIGASSLKHLEENLEALSKGPLPEDVVQALNQGWEVVRGKELKFWH
ncbi:Aldo/keto reductase [Aspergillus ellipticus CBS 707.79]|uniref:Aldo/keto reductase n=1 Tax=Aspergillus ellipticus CBS 707.79 TaxID=1448320 RepID=A0A319DBG6_9EURO|nr:Aldo/keto reductase [Aspergillus ellipticus CBS 707.79]